MGERGESPSTRAVAIGLASVVAICGFAFYHDGVLSRGARLIPHLMPPVVYGGLIVCLLCVNPLLRKLRAGWPLSGRELAFVTALALVACSVPFYGLVHCWPTALMLPHHYGRVSPGWHEGRVLESVPQRMLAETGGEGEGALVGYTTGLAQGTEGISPFEVPWSAWGATLAFWVPVALSMTIALVGLALVVHHQWARNEHLPYPISAFAHSLLPEEGRAGTIFGERGFWWAAGAVFAIHMLNYLCAWWPERLVQIPLQLDFSTLEPLAPTLVRGGPSRLLFHPRIMFSVIGVAYFFATDVSLSLAVGPVLVCWVLGVLAGYGISMHGGINYLFESRNAFIYLGGYAGLFVMMLYTGRHYYLTVLGRSVGVRTRDEPPAHLVWGMRVFLAGLLFFCAELVLLAGVNPILALLYAAIAVMVFVVVSRAVAETGGFYVGTWIMPSAVLLGFLGPRALGPGAVAAMAMVGVVLMSGPGWAPMPFAVQALKLADLSRVDLSRTARWIGMALVVGVAVALPATIYWQYSEGAMAASSGWAQYTSKLPFDVGLHVKYRLEAQGSLDAVSRSGSWARLLDLSPNWPMVVAFGVTAALAMAVSVCRLRFAWWPLHPIVFFFLHSHQIQRLAFSFLLGWAFKAAVSRYGGHATCRKLVPVAVGLVAGEVVAALVPIVVGVVYRLATGDAPAYHSVFLL